MSRYRDSVVMPIVALIFIVVPFSAATVPALYHVATGTPLMISNGKHTTGQHVASSGELLFSIFFPFLFVFFGVLAFLYWKNDIIQTDENGLREYGLTRNIKFQSPWKDLTSAYKRTGQKGSVYYVIEAASGKIEIPSSERNLQDLIGEIKRRADHVDFSGWD